MRLIDLTTQEQILLTAYFALSPNGDCPAEYREAFTELADCAYG